MTLKRSISTYMKVLVLGSWGLYLVVLLVSLPLPPEAVWRWVLSAAITIVGIFAGISALRESQSWRTWCVTASMALLLLAFGRLAVGVAWNVSTWKVDIFAASATYFSEAWKILLTLSANRGIASAALYAYDFVAMPVLQLTILILLLRSFPASKASTLTSH
jgi:hypothetical protein